MQELENRDYYHRVTLALDDLLRTKAYCETLLSLDSGKSFTKERYIYEGLCIAMVVSYSRVFCSSKTVNENTNKNVSNRFGKLINKKLNSISSNLSKLHKRILEKRDKVFAHSDASSRNYTHHSNSELATGRNPFHPYDSEEVELVLELVKQLIETIGFEQSRVAAYTFENNIFNS